MEGDGAQSKAPDYQQEQRALPDSRTAIWAVFIVDLEQPLNSSFQAHLLGFRNEVVKSLMRVGYRIRRAERYVFSERPLVPLGLVHETLCSLCSSDEKIESIIHYLDLHQTSDPDDPIRLYTLVPLQTVNAIFDRFLTQNREIIDASPVGLGDVDIHSELCHRYLAYGYIYRVAEEFVVPNLLEVPANNKAKSAKPRHGGLCIWSTDAERTNSQMVDPIRVKAIHVADLVEITSYSTLTFVAGMRGQFPDIRLAEKEARGILSETAVLFIRVAEEMASPILTEEHHDKFMEDLVACVSEMLEAKGVTEFSFVELLRDRIGEYCACQKWVPSKGESAKGTLLWEFGKRLAEIVGMSKNALFLGLLGNLLLASLIDWRLRELLQGHDLSAGP